MIIRTDYMTEIKVIVSGIDRFDAEGIWKEKLHFSFFISDALAMEWDNEKQTGNDIMEELFKYYGKVLDSKFNEFDITWYCEDTKEYTHDILFCDIVNTLTYNYYFKTGV